MSQLEAARWGTTTGVSMNVVGSIATLGKVGPAPMSNMAYVHLAHADRLTLTNSFFDGTRGASAAIFGGGDAASPRLQELVLF